MDIDVNWGGILGKIALAIVIILVTWLVARLVRWAIGKLVGKLSFLQRTGSDGKSVGQSVATVASLLVWLFGLMALLQVFALTQVLAPIQTLLTGVLGFLPNLIGALFVFVIGFVIAKIVRQLVETAIRAVNFSKITEKVRSGADKVVDTASGDRAADDTAVMPAAAPAEYQAGGAVPPATEGYAAPATEGYAAPAAQGYAAPQGAAPTTPAQPAAAGGLDNNKIAGLVGNLVFAIILIVVSIAALQILGITAISAPAEQMLTLILNAIPSILAAAIILGLGYLIASFVGNLLQQVLEGFGTDRAIAKLEIVPEGQSASAIITRIAQVAIMVFFAIMATRALNFPEITEILDEVLSLGGRVVFGGVIIAVGVLLAGMLAKMVGTGTASTVIRWATIALFGAMGLSFMGIADSIINLAFGAVVVGGALAAALAFGLGGRDAAARSLQKLQQEKAPVAPSTPPASPPPTPPAPGQP